MTLSDDVLNRPWVVISDVRPGVRHHLVVAEWVQHDGPMPGLHRATIAQCVTPELAEHITRLHNDNREEATDAPA